MRLAGQSGSLEAVFRRVLECALRPRDYSGPCEVVHPALDVLRVREVREQGDDIRRSVDLAPRDVDLGQ